MRGFGKFVLIGWMAANLGACTGDPRVPSQDELVAQVQRDLNAAAASDPATFRAVRPVRPVVTCIERQSSNQFVAHFDPRGLLQPVCHEAARSRSADELCSGLIRRRGQGDCEQLRRRDLGAGQPLRDCDQIFPPLSDHWRRRELGRRRCECDGWRERRGRRGHVPVDLRRSEPVHDRHVQRRHRLRLPPPTSARRHGV